jgi:YD repeat-containing protein
VVEYDEAEKRLIEQTYNKRGQLVGETRYVYEYYED